MRRIFASPVFFGTACIESCTRGSPRWTVTTPERDGHGVLHYRLTVARVRCGTQQVNDHLHATCWRRLAPDSCMWRESDLPLCEQGFEFLARRWVTQNTSVFSWRFTIAKHRTLLERIPAVQDVHSEWALLFHCAGRSGQLIAQSGAPFRVLGQLGRLARHDSHTIS